MASALKRFPLMVELRKNKIIFLIPLHYKESPSKTLLAKIFEPGIMTPHNGQLNNTII